MSPATVSPVCTCHQGNRQESERACANAAGARHHWTKETGSCIESSDLSQALWRPAGAFEDCLLGCVWRGDELKTFFKNHSDALFLCSLNTKNVTSHCSWFCLNSLQGRFGLENYSGAHAEMSQELARTVLTCPRCDARRGIGIGRMVRLCSNEPNNQKQEGFVVSFPSGDSTVLSDCQLGSFGK